MKILRKISETKRITSALILKKKTIGFVPTMGYLHEGHLSLVKAARKKADVVIVSIFVNPLQFAPNEDFTKYPRNFKKDEKLCRNEGVDYIFYPDIKEMYPDDYSTYVIVENVSLGLEGKIRPEHFRGVATIVLKLFNIVQCSFAVFGQKDAQQACVIKKMAEDLNVNTKIIISPTIREKDGLAMSSRNVYLNPEQREDAAYLYKALEYARRKLTLENYNRDIEFIRGQISKLIKSRKTATKIDYISFNNSRTLEEVKTLKNLKNTDILISLAVRFGKVRLIDNIVIKR
ncbi:MAG: pantoate--beta-alanine ligase [Ignavibacteria bacterium]|nr:pantoate--beta-alanine ligase [Ignavibacteria bacterium]